MTEVGTRVWGWLGDGGGCRGVTGERRVRRVAVGLSRDDREVVYRPSIWGATRVMPS